MNKDDVQRIFKTDLIDLPNGASVSAEGFALAFREAPSNPSYDDLKSIDGYIDKENQGMGYKKFFDQCKADGILL